MDPTEASPHEVRADLPERDVGVTRIDHLGDVREALSALGGSRSHGVDDRAHRCVSEHSRRRVHVETPRDEGEGRLRGESVALSPRDGVLVEFHLVVLLDTDGPRADKHHVGEAAQECEHPAIGVASQTRRSPVARRGAVKTGDEVHAQPRDGVRECVRREEGLVVEVTGGVRKQAVDASSHTFLLG